MKLKSLLSTLLLAAVLLSSAACAGTNNGNAPQTTAADALTETTAAETTAEKINYLSANLPSEKLDGYEYRIIAPTASVGEAWWYLDVDEQTGEIYNDAVFERNATIEDAFDVVIKSVLSDNTTDFSNDVKNAVAAGDDLFDAAYGAMNTLNPIMLGEMLIDLHTVDHFNFDAQWWDGNFVDSFTIKDKLFYASGSISPIVDLRSYIMVFNKDLAADIGYDSPYEYVLNGTWTNEYFAKYIKGVNSDLNGDGEMNYDDRWGYLSENQASAMLAVSYDARIVEKDSSDALTVKLLEERSITRLAAALELIIDPETTILVNPLVQANGNNWAVASDWFAGGGALIRSVCFEDVPLYYRTMEQDFGIVPFPKYDEAQENYRTCVAQSGNVVCLPVTVSDPDRSALILEAMAAESIETIMPAFYDIALTGKYVRDDESADMLDIIIDTKVYDLGYILDVGGFRMTMLNLENNKSSDVVSAMTAIESKMNEWITKQMEVHLK